MLYKLPLITTGQRKLKWNNSSAEKFYELLCSRLNDDAPTRYSFKYAKKTYYYRVNNRFPMLQLCFKNLKAMSHCANLLKNPIKTDDWGYIKCCVWEDSISLVRKLLTARQVRFSQWFRIIGKKVPEEIRISTLEEEYIVEWDTMESIPTEETKSWVTYPRILAFDIECYSNNHRAMPDKYNALHVAYLVSCIFQIDEKETNKETICNYHW